MLNKLNSILLSDNVVEKFHEAYKDEQFREWVLNVVPEVKACMELKQDNPWHIYNCLDHILYSVENMNKYTKTFNAESKRLLAYTMFLHDIGKPECYIRRFSKLYNREVDSFFNHNKAGVKIAKRVAIDFAFNETQSKQIQALIEDHDMFMFLTLKDDGNKFHRVLDETVINDEIEKLNSVGDGFQLMQYLILVGMSDNMAQNPEMTKNSLQLLDIMNNMLINRLG